MRKNRCQLCGGKIHQGRCSLCGWINQTEDSYLLNTSSCDTKKLTHVHEEDSYGSWKNESSEKKKSPKKSQKESNQPRTKRADHRGRANTDIYRNQRSEKPKKKSVGTLIGLLVTILLAPGALEGAAKLVQNISEKINPKIETTVLSQQDGYDPYAYVTRELSQQGESWEEILEPGNYDVGTDMPEGVYEVALYQGEGSMNLDDAENGIYLWRFFSEEDVEEAVTQFDDLRLYEGAHLSIADGLVLELSTSNGQSKDMSSLENPLTETVSLEKEVRLTAGEDFPAGVYDIQIEEGWSIFSYEIPRQGMGEDDEYMDYNSIILSAEGEYEKRYKNVVLPQGTVVEAQDEDMILVPSSRIVSENYSDYYK